MARLQRYVSSELTHFVGRAHRGNEGAQFDLLVHILKTGLLTSTPGKRMPWGGRISLEYLVSTNLMVNPYAVCFCDIPVADLGIHMGKYSRFGVAFEKSFLISRGANPMWYIAKNSIAEHRALRPDPRARNPYPRARMPRSDYYDLAIRRFQRFSPSTITVDESNDLAEFHDFFEWELLAFVKFFDDTKPEDDSENWYMEREWRVIGEVEFELEDVRRVILPMEYGARLREDVPEYHGQVAFAPA